MEQARISLRFISHVAVTVCALRPSISVAPESRNVFLFLFIFSSPFALLDGSVSVQDGRTRPCHAAATRVAFMALTTSSCHPMVSVIY